VTSTAAIFVLPSGQVDPRAVLLCTAQSDYSQVLVVGCSLDDEISVSSSTDSLAEIVLLLERAKRHILKDVEF